MKSIRRNLTVWLLSGLAVLWIAAGAGVLYSARAGLLKAVDTELAIDAQVLRYVARGDEGGEADGSGERRGFGRVIEDRAPGYQEEGGGSFYQTWNADGNAIERSPSLGDHELPFAGKVEGDPVFSTVSLSDGSPVRAMSFQVSPGGRGRGKAARRRADDATVITIARSLEATNQAVSTLLGGIAVVGLLAGGGTILLVGMALNRGLKPLRQLGEQAESIQVTALDSRFTADTAPLELRPIYERLNDLMGRIEKSFERERRFSSDLAHEMRTPVAELKMLSEVALKWPDQAGAATHSENLQIAHQLESMIENLLALARWESGEVALKVEPIDLETLVRECWQPWAKQAEKKALRVSMDFSEVPCLETDAGMLRHVVGNLLSNAVEYSPESEEIVIRGANGGLEIANVAQELEPSDVEHLFDRYWRRDESRGDSHHAGLGLSLARACADAIGFQLEAALEKGVLTFRLFP